MRSRRSLFATALLFVLWCSCSGAAQLVAVEQDEVQPVPNVDYPKYQAGVFIQGDDWATMQAAMPAKTRAKRGVLSAMSYGAVPATVVAEYAGTHANVQVLPGRPVICICHMISLPGTPVIVKLHPKKDSRELDGGRMIVYPVVGNSKIADANKSDLVAVETLQPENQVWLVQPKEALPPGEYALMLGTQNVNIFPFTVAGEQAKTK